MKDSLFSSNGLGFDSALAEQRRATNYISKAIDNEEIKMICEP